MTNMTDIERMALNCGEDAILAQRLSDADTQRAIDILYNIIAPRKKIHGMDRILTAALGMEIYKISMRERE